jgi:hypothetical protein
MLQRAFTALGAAVGRRPVHGPAASGPAARDLAALGLAALSLAALGAGLMTGAGASAARAAAGGHPGATAARQPLGPTERGIIVGWPGGNAVIYPTAGFFTNPQILAVGSVRPDGSFAVQLPARVPVDLLGRSTGQCATLRSSDPAALSTFTGDDLIYARGVHIGNAHSGSTPGVASFTSFANGATRSGFVYSDRDTTLTGFCERTISTGGVTADFLQNFDLRLHQGWNQVVAYFSVPLPGHIVADLKLGSGSAHENWYFFQPAAAS